ncbi:hypothetical protein EYF80_009086 [Liparis tanakae]|uniref:Uncharacterized protein n=1 Tax=Liparis tanakae TaxID=230148 RepID=A0A4Z2IRE7_9TELE|nr:hypothetical protein EYF80_009086 [Liparis tanakae]
MQLRNENGQCLDLLLDELLGVVDLLRGASDDKNLKVGVSVGGRLPRDLHKGPSLLVDGLDVLSSPANHESTLVGRDGEGQFPSRGPPAASLSPASAPVACRHARWSRGTLWMERESLKTEAVGLHSLSPTMLSGTLYSSVLEAGLTPSACEDDNEGNRGNRSCSSLMNNKHYKTSPCLRPKHVAAVTSPHLPGPLHRVRKRIFYDGTCSVPENRLSVQRVLGSGRGHRVELRHVDEQRGEGTKPGAAAAVGRKVMKLTGQGKHRSCYGGREGAFAF